MLNMFISVHVESCDSKLEYTSDTLKEEDFRYMFLVPALSPLSLAPGTRFTYLPLVVVGRPQGVPGGHRNRTPNPSWKKGRGRYLVVSIPQVKERHELLMYDLNIHSCALN